MVYVYHSFLIHSSVDGHLGCFHVGWGVWMDTSLSKLQDLVKEGKPGVLQSMGSQRVFMTERLNWTEWRQQGKLHLLHLPGNRSQHISWNEIFYKIVGFMFLKLYRDLFIAGVLTPPLELFLAHDRNLKIFSDWVSISVRKLKHLSNFFFNW